MYFFKSTLLLLLVFLLGHCSSNKTLSNSTEYADKNTLIKKEAILEKENQEKILEKDTDKTKPEPSTSNTTAISKDTQTPQNTSTNSISPKSSLKGKILLFDAEGKNLSAEGAIIELKKIQPNLNNAINNKSHVIDTRAKTYIPAYLTVNVGDTLIFKNNDAIKHNVFSSSGKNTFDLGTYGYNRVKQHQVAYEGIIKVYCNIHPEMAVFISASKGNNTFITDTTGDYTFKDIDPGKYLLSVWHLRGTQEQAVTIREKHTQIQNVSIDTSSYKPEPRVNKHGEAYKKKPAIFKDEFY